MQLWKTPIAASGAPRAETQDDRKATCLGDGEQGENDSEERDSTPRLLLDEVLLPRAFELHKGTEEAPQQDRKSAEPLAAVPAGARVLLVKGPPEGQIRSRFRFL